MRAFLGAILFLFFISGKSQLLIGPDTISTVHNNYCLKMPWAGGINAAIFSNVDINYDGKKDLVIYDKLNNSALGAFKCFENIGTTGQTKYKHKPELTKKFPHIYNWAVFQDYDMDGKEDLFCSVTGGIQVWRNIGNMAAGLQFTLSYSLLYSDYNPGGPPSVSNIYAGPVGIPSITDVDNDGDLDILTFSPTGIYIEYHKNKSKELFSHSDSLRFELGDGCWGKISENGCLVSLNQCPVRPPKDMLAERGQGIQHAGAALMAFDSDGDGDKDLIIGDISCNTIEYCHNDGTIASALITDTTKRYPNYPNVASTTQIKFNSFPSTFYVDVDNDNVKDLIASPNTFGSENATSVWYYKNTSTTNTVNFNYVKNNFLQDEMIEVGQMSRPVLLDYNSDGKKDLLIGSNGIYQNNSRKPRFYLYENIGTLSQPAFTLVSNDYANLSSVLNASIISAVPAPGDIDGDGDIDLIVVTNGNALSWYENTAGAGNTCNFSNFKFNHFSISFPSSDPIPQLFDYNKDSKLDLMVGTKNGKVYYYQNNGTATAPSFSLITGSFPNVSLKGDFFIYGLDGFGAPFFYNEGTSTKMLGGCITGQIYLWDIPSTPTATCTLIDSTANGIEESTYSTPWFEDINGDSKPDLFIGNAGGGLSFYSSKAPDVSIHENEADAQWAVTLFPNPTKNKVSLIMQNGIQLKSYKLFNILGEELKHSATEASGEFDLSELPQGVYMFRFVFTNGTKEVKTTKKLIKE